MYKNLGYKIIYTDEFCTTRTTMLSHSWSLKNAPLKFNTSFLNGRTIASIVAISSEAGMDLLMNFEKSINSTKFIEFLYELRAQQPDERLAIFLDRLNVHRSLRVKNVCDELGIARIFISSYSPNFNPIEGVIGVINNALKR